MRQARSGPQDMSSTLAILLLSPLWVLGLLFVLVRVERWMLGPEPDWSSPRAEDADPHRP